jgi:hypothetical protein
MALLPYSVRQVTHRSKGKRGDRDRDDRGRPPEGDAPVPSPDAPPPTGGEAAEGAEALDTGVELDDAVEAEVEAASDEGAPEAAAENEEQS